MVYITYRVSMSMYVWLVSVCGVSIPFGVIHVDWIALWKIMFLHKEYEYPRVLTI